MAVIGVGTQDDLALAKKFVSETGVTFPMTWDKSGKTWVDFGVPAQPAMILYNKSGNEVRRWNGVFNKAEVADAVSQLG